MMPASCYDAGTIAMAKSASQLDGAFGFNQRYGRNLIDDSDEELPQSVADVQVVANIQPESARGHRANATEDVRVEPFESDPELRPIERVDDNAAKDGGAVAELCLELDVLAHVRRRSRFDLASIDAHVDDARVRRIRTLQHHMSTECAPLFWHL